MKRLTKNNLNSWISIFILLHPIIDLITGVGIHYFQMSLTIGTVVRVTFLLFIMFCTIFVYKKRGPFLYYLLVGIYSLLYIISIFQYKEGIGLLKEIQGLIRTFYFPILLLSFYELKEEIHISKKTLGATLILYLICIFVPTIFGIGYQSYQITKQGTLGFYHSANEISGIISILTPILFLLLKENKRYVLNFLLLIIYLVVIFTVGTKTPLLSLIITIGMLFIWIVRNCLKNKNYKPVIISCSAIIIGVVGLLLVIPETNFYKNIKTHLEYLEVDNVFDIVKDKELIDHFIFSQRLTFWENRNKSYDNSSLYQKIIGIGYFENGREAKQIEMDYIDVFYNHGIVGFTLFFGVYIYVLIELFRIKTKMTLERYMVVTSILLILFLSFFTGHIITAPAVSLIAIILILDLKNVKKEELRKL